MTTRMTSKRMTQRLLGGGLVAGPLFTLGYLLEGASREGYSAWRHPVSSLALGKHGWQQTLNFLVSGGLLMGSAIGTRRANGASAWPARLIGAVGLGLVGAGVFACDPIGGYPPGTPLSPDRPTPRGVLHRLFSSLVFFGLPALFVLEARRGKSFWAGYSVTTCAAFVGSFALSSAGFAQAPGLANLGGLFQRMSLSAGFAWLTLRAARTLRDLNQS